MANFRKNIDLYDIHDINIILVYTHSVILVI